MISLLRRCAIAAVVGGVLGVAALVLEYARHPAITLEMDRRTGTVVAGLYDAEWVNRETFAWTRRSATMSLPGLDRSREWSCTIRLRGGRPDESTLPQVLIAVDGVVAATALTTNAYQEVRVPLPARPRAAGASVTITASNTFVPGPSDSRTLGVMLDRWSCAPSAGGVVRPPPRALYAAAAASAAFGAAFALLGAGLFTTICAAGAVALAQAVPLAWELGTFTAFPWRAAWLAVGVAGALVAAVRAAEGMLGRQLSGAARVVAACSAAVLYLKLIALLHPSKPIVDLVFHAHRLQWVLDGRLYFTQPMPSGVRFPYAIGLYVFAAPWTLLTSDFELLLRIVVSTAEAVGAILVYLLVSRMWHDRLAGVLAATLFHLVPRTFEIVGNANLTNAFAQSLALATLSAAVLWKLQRGDRLQFAAFTLLTAWALLSHISTFTLLGGILLGLAVLYRVRGGLELRQPARAVLVALLLAAGLSVALYYAHFGDAYRSASRVRAQTDAAADATGNAGAPAASAAARAPVGLDEKAAEAGRLSVAAVGWPICLLAMAGAWPFWRRGMRDRLSLAVLALLATFGAFVASVVLMPVERSFQRYAAEFISRVTLATYPSAVMLAGLGAAYLWRRGWPGRLATAALLAWAAHVGAAAWIDWLR